MFVNNNVRFCYQSIYEQEKIKIENLLDDDLEQSESEESDSGSNDETESDDEFNE